MEDDLGGGHTPLLEDYAFKGGMTPGGMTPGG